jgi:phage tail-like protein
MKMRVALGLAAGALLAAIAVGAALAAGHHRAAASDDAITAARFSLTIDGVEIAAFSELAGISSGADAEDFVDSSKATGPVLTKLPGKRKPPTVTLRRGLTNSLELSAWHQQVLTGDIAAAARSATLVVYDAEGKPVVRYHLEHAWPSKLEVGALKAGASEVLMETVTLVCENIQRVAP